MKPTPGNHMKILRTFMRIKQKDLATKLRIPAPLLTMYENDTRKVPIEFLERFCNYFDITMSQFFSYDYRVLENVSQGVR